jgi:hypothetical protein
MHGTWLVISELLRGWKRYWKRYWLKKILLRCSVKDYWQDCYEFQRNELFIFITNILKLVVKRSWNYVNVWCDRWKTKFITLDFCFKKPIGKGSYWVGTYSIWARILFLSDGQKAVRPPQETSLVQGRVFRRNSSSRLHLSFRTNEHQLLCVEKLDVVKNKVGF